MAQLSVSIALLFLLRSTEKAVGFSIPLDEYNALLKLYDSTQGRNWKWRSTELFGSLWDFNNVSSDPCVNRWQGLTCSSPTVSIAEIDLSSYNLNGTLPNAIGNLSNLQSLSLYNNSLHGVIPESIGKLEGMEYFDLSYNKFSGSIPSSISNFCQLQSISLHSNQLNSSIPDMFGCMGVLFQVYLGFNYLTSTLPSSIYTLQNLITLTINNNYLSGPVLEHIEGVTALVYCNLYQNKFSGSISNNIGSLRNLQWLYISDNKIISSIPDSFGSLTNLWYFNGGNNWMTGTLPSSMGNLVLLQQLMLYNNYFTGSIPNSFGNFKTMLLLILAANRLHGPIPATIGQLTNVEYVDITNNALSGSIPSEIGYMRNLEIMYLFANILSGGIPSSIASLPRLKEVKLQSNKLSSSIPTSISQMRVLSALILDDNQLTGNLDGIFNATAQLSLATIEFSHNLLTGIIPGELFRLHNIVTVVAVSNCFAGALPETLCYANSVRTLALDGMRSAPNCQKRLISRISSAYQVSHPWHGTLPSCVFNLPQLSTLHLSGNGFTGTIPSALNMSVTFTGLSLSHNALVGNVPLSIQTKVWESLDLSYNRLSGTLSESFAESITHNTAALNQVAVILDNNRLSGSIPRTVAHLANVSILKSNMFTCALDKSDLPSHDHARSNYQCGSNNFDAPFFAWLCTTSIASVVFAVTVHHKKHVLNDIWNLVFQWYTAADETMVVYAIYSEHLHAFARVSLKCTMYILLVVAPLCICLSVYQGTVQYQNAYIVSAGFIHGRDATALLATTFSILIVLFALWFALEIYAINKDHHSLRSSRLPEKKRDFLERASVYTVFIMINFTFVIGVNGAYVYAVINASGNVLLIVQILLSFFKIFWGKICSGYLVRYISNYISGFKADAVAQYSKEFMSIQLIISLFNIIAIPCLVVAVVSPRCFNNVFVAAPEVTAVYAYTDCTTGFNPNTDICAGVVTTSTTEYIAPFTYSYQCSSTFITYYAPAFMYMCITATFLQPTLSLVLYTVLKNNYTRETWWRKWLYKSVPRLWKLPLLESPPLAVRDTYRPVLPSNSITTTTLTYLGILLTFGAVFPPLAVAILLTIGVTVLTTRLSVGRFILWANADINFRRQGYLQVIELECRDMVSMVLLRDAIRIIVIFCCSFYTLFLFDTLGDTEGFTKSVWVLFFFPLFPLLLYPVFYWYSRVQSEGASRPVSVNATGVEMDVLSRTEVLECTKNALI